jgi:hypothetical protein
MGRLTKVQSTSFGTYPMWRLGCGFLVIRIHIPWPTASSYGHLRIGVPD